MVYFTEALGVVINSFIINHNVKVIYFMVYCDFNDRNCYDYHHDLSHQKGFDLSFYILIPDFNY